MAPSPITSWQIDGKTMETVTDFIFLGSKIFADCDFSHEIKRHLLLERKAVTNLDSILKSQRHYFADKVLSSQSYSFSSSHVWMWELNHKERWVPKNWCFWTMVLEKALKSPLDWRRLNQLVLKDINPECSLEWLMVKLKLQFYGPLMQKTDSFEKTLMLRTTEGREEGDDGGWDGWMAALTPWTWVWGSSGCWWWRGKPGMLQSMGWQGVGYDWAIQLNWTDFSLTRGPNISGFCAILFFTESDFTFSTWNIHNWVLFPLWLSLFILSVAISPLLPIAYRTPTDLGGGEVLIFQFHIILPFQTPCGVLKARIWSGLPSPSPVDHVLSELSTMTHLTSVTLHSMAHSFIKFHKAVIHVII